MEREFGPDINELVEEDEAGAYYSMYFQVWYLKMYRKQLAHYICKQILAHASLQLAVSTHWFDASLWKGWIR